MLYKENTYVFPINFSNWNLDILLLKNKFFYSTPNSHENVVFWLLPDFIHSCSYLGFHSDFALSFFECPTLVHLILITLWEAECWCRWTVTPEGPYIILNHVRLKCEGGKTGSKERVPSYVTISMPSRYYFF